MSKMVLPKIVEVPRSDKNASGLSFTDATLNKWHVTNGQYKTLTPRQQRMVIAADVVALLDARKMKAKHGIYVGTMRNKGWKHGVLQDARSMLRKFLRKGGTCNVCAMGATFLATLERVNTLEIKGSYQLAENAGSGNFVAEKGPFTHAQQRVLEHCFELRGGYWNPNQDDPDRRIRCLMMNLISNEGKLVLHRGPYGVRPVGTVDNGDYENLQYIPIDLVEW